MSKQFASHADLSDKVVSFEKLSDNAYAYTAEGDPNTGVIIGDEAVMVVDTQATPVMAQDVIRRIREVTDKPIKYILLSHYHAVRVFGASAYNAQEILASRDTYDLIVERGEQDKASEIGRFPRLFRNAESIPPGLVWPTMTFKGEMTVNLGNLEVKLLQVAAATPRATPSPGCPSRRSCSPATWSNTSPPPTAATPTSATGPARWTRCRASRPKRWCPAAARRSRTPPKCARAWPARAPS